MKVLVVDDSKSDILLISAMLKGYELRIAYDGIDAMEILGKEIDIDVMILDLNMPRMNGFEVLEALGREPGSHHVATLILTNYDETENEIRGLELGAVDYIRKPLNLSSLRKRLELHFGLINARRLLEDHNRSLENTVRERTAECVKIRDITVHALLGLLEIRNIESSNHTKRTQRMMKALCQHMSSKAAYRDVLTEARINELCSTSPLHDIGKVGIPDAILLKPGKLTEDEYEFMKNHTTYGVEALKCEECDGVILPFIETAAELIGTHHEKFDGTGYPNGLKGRNIPLSGRLMAIIDVYDALVSTRVYKAAYPHASAMQIIADGRSTHFDPDIVDAFFEIEEQIRSIAGTSL